MSWLSVGKSFSGTPAGVASSTTGNNETLLKVHVSKEESKPEANEIVLRQHIERKKKKRKKEKDHSEAKHKKHKRHKRNNTDLIQNDHSIVNINDQNTANLNSNAVVVDDVEDEESISSFEHSSDSDNDMHRSIRSQNAVKLSKVDVVYMPNGQVALLDKDRDVGSTYTWSVDTSMDRDICMFLDIKKTRWSSMRLTIQNPSQNYIKKCAENTFASRFCDDVYDWDFMNTKSKWNTDLKSKKWRYYTKSFFQSFADSQQNRLFYDYATPLADTARSFRLSLQATLLNKKSEKESKTLAVSQYGFVAVPPVDMSTTGGVLDAGGKAMMTTDSDLAFLRVKAFRQKYSQAELLKGDVDRLLDFLLQQKSLQRWTLLSASGAEPVSIRFLKICADWAADKAVTEKILSLIEEHRKLGGESRDHPSVHMLYMKLKINLLPGNIVEQQWRETILYCPSSFELRLAKWSNLTLSMSTTSVRRTREEHVVMMRSIENDMKNAQLARLLTENMWKSTGAAEDLPLRLQEDINAAKIDATLGLLLLERQLGNVERAIAIVQGLLELNFEVIPKLNIPISKDRAEKAIGALGIFWDSEHPRIGEDLSSPFKAGAVSCSSGYGHWADNGNTTENTDSMSHLPSDYGPNIRKRLKLLHSGGAGCDVIRTVLQGLLGEEEKDRGFEAKSVPVYSSNEGDTIKDPAAPEMPQPMPQPQAKSLKPSAAKYMEKDMTEMVTEVKEPEDAAEDGMVYSRIHGYRIPIRQEDSLSSYRRVLEKLHGPTAEDFNGDVEGRGDAVDREALVGAKGKRQKNESVNSEAWISPHQISDEDCRLESTEVGYSVRWVHDFLLSSMQWRPLRANFNSHYIATSPGSEDDAIELDRVIFFEDIRDHVFALSPGKIDAIADGIDLEDSTLGFSFRLHQRMVVRCVEALGLSLPLASCSHSLQRRHLNSHLQADNIAAECCPLLDIILRDNLHSAAMNDRESSSRVPTPPRQRLLISQQRICLLNKVLSSNHKVGFSMGFDTELNFLIRLLESLLTVSAKGNKTKLTALFKLHLRSVLMQLAVDRWEASYDCKAAAACEGNAFLAKADVESVRSYCRDLVESTVLQDSDSPGAQDMQYYSSLGSFVAWAAYIRAERQIHLISSKSESDCIPALKVVDKIFKAVGQQQHSGAAHFPSGFLEFNRVSLELLIDCVSTRLKSGNPSAVDVPSCQHRQQSCREVAFAAFQMVRCLVSCSAWGESQSATGICYTTFFKFIYSGSGKRSKSENSFAASDVTMVVDAVQAKVQSLLNEAKLRVQDARGRRRTEQSIAACRIHMAPCHYIDATPELYDVIYMLTWIQFLALVFVDVDGIAALTASRVAAAAHVADSCLLASINLIRELLMADRAAEDIGIAEAEFLGSSVWDSQVEISLMVLVERLHLSRLLILEVAIEWLPHCIRIDSTDCNRERRNLLESLQTSAVTGLKDFPLNPSLLNRLVTCTSGLSTGACSLKGCLLTRSYFNSLQSRRLWCGGLMTIEKYFLLYFLIESANMSARRRSNSWTLRDACGSLGVAIKVDEVGCADWSDEACSAIVSALEQCLSSTNRDSLFGGDAGLWLLYFHLLSRINTSRKGKSGVSPKIARGLWYRALSASTAGKALWLASMGPLRGAFAAKELKTIADSLESCGLWLRR